MYTTAATYGTKQDRMIFGEKSDHLGNVRAVVSDIRKPSTTTGDIDDWTWTADVTQSFAYYPFGMQMPGQANTAQTVENGEYKFGFNGKLRDDSWHNAAGTVYDYGFRIYDARIAKFLSVDPLFKSYPWYTPYQFAGNKPIAAIDLDGLEDYYYVLEKHQIWNGENYVHMSEFGQREIAKNHKDYLTTVLGFEPKSTGAYLAEVTFDQEGNIIDRKVSYMPTATIVRKKPEPPKEKTSFSQKIANFEASIRGNSYYDNAKYEGKEGLNKYGWKLMGLTATFVVTGGMSSASAAGWGTWTLASTSMAKNINDLSDDPIINTNEGAGRKSAFLIDAASWGSNFYEPVLIPLKIPSIITDTKAIMDYKFAIPEKNDDEESETEESP